MLWSNMGLVSGRHTFSLTQGNDGRIFTTFGESFKKFLLCANLNLDCIGKLHRDDPSLRPLSALLLDYIKSPPKASLFWLSI